MNFHSFKSFALATAAKVFFRSVQSLKILKRLNKKNSRVVLLVGIPGSGKSTLAKELFHENVFQIHSTDTIRELLYGDEATQGDWSQIEIVLKAKVALSLLLNRIPIIDATHAHKSHRTHAIAWLRSLGVSNVSALYVSIPLSTCIERNQKRRRVVPVEVLQRMHASLAEFPPSLQDGFDTVDVKM